MSIFEPRYLQTCFSDVGERNSMHYAQHTSVFAKLASSHLYTVQSPGQLHSAFTSRSCVEDAIKSRRTPELVHLAESRKERIL